MRQTECFSPYNGRARCGTEMYNVDYYHVCCYITQSVQHQKTDLN